MNQIVKIPQAKNEPVKSYAPGDTETLNLKSKLQEMKNTPVDIPMYIGSKEIFTEAGVVYELLDSEIETYENQN